MHLEQNRREFHSLYYIRHNQRRLEHLASLGLNLYSRRVLELGAGAGDLTGFFLDRGCTVVSVEPRKENCVLFEENMKNYGFSGYPFSLIATDIHEFFDIFGKSATYDIVFCYGLLYHLADPKAAVENMAQVCQGQLLLESCVSLECNRLVNQVSEDATSPSQSFHGIGCRPSRSYLFSLLRDNFRYVYVPKTQPAHLEFPCDWHWSDSAAPFNRAVFVASQEKIKSDRLVTELPMKQVRA